MYRQICLLAVTSLLTFSAGSASANTMLSADNFSNRLDLQVTGSENRLLIDQAANAEPGNSLVLAVTGDLNGGPLGRSFSGSLAASPLTPGSIMQTGSNNFIRGQVIGNGNLFAFAQSGSGNSLTASMTGQNNQASVVQFGTNNIAGFSQSGIGNMVSITQRSY